MRTRPIATTLLLGTLLWTPLGHAQDSGGLGLFDATVQTVQTQVGASAITFRMCALTL